MLWSAVISAAHRWIRCASTNQREVSVFCWLVKAPAQFLVVPLPFLHVTVGDSLLLQPLDELCVTVDEHGPLLKLLLDEGQLGFIG